MQKGPSDPEVLLCAAVRRDGPDAAAAYRTHRPAGHRAVLFSFPLSDKIFFFFSVHYFKKQKKQHEGL